MSNLLHESKRNVVDVVKFLRENPEELVVSVYDKLRPGILCSFPLDDAILYSEGIKAKEILPYMDARYADFHWSLIWSKIKNNRESI